MARIAFYTFGILRESKGHEQVQGFYDILETAFETAENAEGFIDRDRVIDEERGTWGPRGSIVLSNSLRPALHGRTVCPLLREAQRSVDMSLYMFRVEATAEAVKGVMAEGVAARAANASQVVESLGGKLIGYHMVEGSGATAVILAEFGETESATALAVAVSAAGVGTINYERLLTPEEAQASINRVPAYRPPGG